MDIAAAAAHYTHAHTGRATAKENLHDNHQDGAQTLRTLAAMLDLSVAATAAAHLAYHRFYNQRSADHFDTTAVALGALLLATKLEECPRRLRDLLNVHHRLEQRRAARRRRSSADDDAPPPLTHLDIHSEAYARSRERVVRAEREILKELGFVLYIEHPHKFLLNYVRLRTPAEATSARLAQYAWNFLNDAQRSDACICYRPETLCCAAIWLAAHVERVKLPPSWWDLFEATREDIDAAISDVTSLYGSGASG